MKQLLPLLFLVIISSCDQATKEEKLESQQLEIKPNIVIADVPKIDTVYKDFPSRVEYGNSVFFGMTVSEWNAYLASHTKEGLFDKIDESGRYQSYKAFKTLSSQRRFTFWLEGGFQVPNNRIENKIEIIRINKQIQSEPILNEIDLEYNMTIPDDVNSFITDFIKGHNLKFATGNQPMIVENRASTIEDYKMQNIIEKGFNKDKIANTTKWASVTSQTESVFENDIAYIIIKVKEVRNDELTRDSEGDITSLKEGYSAFTVSTRACSKTFLNIDISQFMTSEQKEKIQSDLKSKELIEKALQK